MKRHLACNARRKVPDELPLQKGDGIFVENTSGAARIHQRMEVNAPCEVKVSTSIDCDNRYVVGVSAIGRHELRPKERPILCCGRQAASSQDKLPIRCVEGS